MDFVNLLVALDYFETVVTKKDALYLFSHMERCCNNNEVSFSNFGTKYKVREHMFVWGNYDFVATHAKFLHYATVAEEAAKRKINYL